jgi:hypothetical protein
VFNEVSILELENLKISFKSEAGSTYYYTETGMYRLSNHWGRLANSKWRLIENEEIIPKNEVKLKLGFALWERFYPDNDVEKLYYLEYDSKNNTINYQHKNNSLFDGKAVLRTTFETRKRIKQARNILELTSWEKYFDAENIDSIRMQIIEKLIVTDIKLDEIKRNLL